MGDLSLEYEDTPYFSVDFGGQELVVEVLGEKAIIRGLDWNTLLYAEPLCEAAESMWPKLVRIAHINGMNGLGVV